MKRIFITFLAIIFTSSVWAQTPQKMSYQAVIRNSSNQLVMNTQIGMQVTILKGSTTGTPVYVETKTPTTNANGLVSIEIGGGTGFDTINWSNDTYFIKTETAVVSPLTSYTITGVSQLLSVPYALHAKTAENIIGGITETDPIFGVSPASTIITGDILKWNTSYGWGNHAGLYRPISWVPAWTDITGKPTLFDGNYNSLSNLPTLNITNWNTAYGWGNHSGLYRPIAWVPSWTDVTGKPTFATVATSGSYTDLTNKPTIDGAETKLSAGANVTITGSGTTASPYVVNSIMNFTQNARNLLTPSAGLIIYNTTTNKPNYYNGSEWMNFDGTSAQTIAIGVNYQGGIIAYILQPGDPGYDVNVNHGLIAASTDQNTGIQWGGSAIFLNSTSVNIGTGNANTIAIVNAIGAGSYAANLCSELVLNGYNDWFLPSQNELNLLYSNKSLIGGFDINSYYWCSSEVSIDYAKVQSFNNGIQYNFFKTSVAPRVRAVRAF